MFEVWDEAEELGYTIDRSHDRTMLDVIELNGSGTQALISYDFTDHTVVTDPTARSLGRTEPKGQVPIHARVDRRGVRPMDDRRMIRPVESIR